MQSDWPVPRCAHSFVCDWIHHNFYMFGGNPSAGHRSNSNWTMRLDDFWKLQVAVG